MARDIRGVTPRAHENAVGGSGIDEDYHAPEACVEW